VKITIKTRKMKSFFCKSLAIGIFLFLSTLFTAFSQKSQENTLKFGRLLRLVESYYVDTTNINKLTEKAIVSMLQELDPHSVYISKEEVDKMNEPLKGNFEGIGISFNIFKDTLLVTSTVPGGPSEKTGLLAGDRILFIDGVKVAGIGLTNNDVFEKLRGEKGTKVDLKIQRKFQKELLDFSIIRDKIPINSLDAAYMLDKETGYIKLNRFSATTMEEFNTAMVALKKEKLKNLVLDLRNNGGGYLNAATNLVEEFLPANRLIVYTEGKNNPKKAYLATNSGSFEEGKLIILINEGSASASEIVAGAVQDWDRGVIVGRRSYGKGLVQQPFNLTDGSMVRLTTAHYYTPSGRCIQKPYEDGIEDYRTDYQKRMENGEMFHADSISFPDSLKYKTLDSGRTVYGGGGIMPDIFVPLDTSLLYQYYNRLQRNNIVYNYILDYIDHHRERISKEYPTFERFKQHFVPGDEMIEAIVAEGIKANIPRDQESIDFTRNTIKKEMKAFIARDIYAKDYFFQVYNEDDTTILKALDLINNPKSFKQLLIPIE
jgi:carboxyl-terminal processing protease